MLLSLVFCMPSMDIIERPVYSPHHWHNYAFYSAISEAGCMGWGNWLVHKQVFLFLWPLPCVCLCVMIVMKASHSSSTNPPLWRMCLFLIHIHATCCKLRMKMAQVSNLRWRVEVCERTLWISTISCAEIENIFLSLQSRSSFPSIFTFTIRLD